MSGIVGIISAGAGVDRTLLERLTDFLSFRGPDGQAVWCGDAAGFGLSWFDTAREAAGRQPPFTLDNRTFVVADARLDGRDDLLRQLRDSGVVCETHATDAELLLHSYRVWGEDCVRHLLGDFAFAVWDEPLQQLFAARDHFGVKPFFYAETPDGLLFGNTLDCLRQHPDVSARLNELAVADHLLFGFNQDPTTTTFADLRRLPPAHTLTAAHGRLRTRRYWSLPTDGSIRCHDPQEIVEQFRDLLRTAVADRLPAGNVAINMSGGLDSTSVAALAQDVLAQRGRAGALHAFTVVYDRLIADEERRYSGLAAEALGLPIRYLAADDYRPFQDTRTGERHFPEPIDDPFTAILSDQLRSGADHGRVVLSGDGGDPLLYGSPGYMMDLLRRFRWSRWLGEVTRYCGAHRRLPPLGLRSWLKRLIGLGPASQPFPDWLNPGFVQRLGLGERWREMTRPLAAAHPTHAEAHQLLSSPYWPYLFEGCNPGTTLISLEIRYPLFDVRLVNFVLAIPPLPWCADKWVLRAAMRNRLPDAIRLRPKRPLSGNPLSALFCLESLKWLDYLEDMRQIAPYVDNERIRLSADSQAPDSLLTRPISLAYWLDPLTSANTVLERETHHYECAQSDAETTLPAAPATGLWDCP
jgi:asparagine synthase (glutamine-hydrolysing)